MQRRRYNTDVVTTETDSNDVYNIEKRLGIRNNVRLRLRVGILACLLLSCSILLKHYATSSSLIHSTSTTLPIIQPIIHVPLRICCGTSAIHNEPTTLTPTSLTPLTWVMFMGDSNMRHTYYWWTNSKIKKSDRTVTLRSSTYGLDRTDLDFGGRWADQEYLVKDKKFFLGAVTPTVRYSFRFLHGSIDEFVNDADDWNIARRGAAHPELETMSKFLETEVNNTLWAESKTNTTINRPSDYALWATKYQTPIDESKSNQFILAMHDWKQQQHQQHMSFSAASGPDVVILTEGWGGVPHSDDFNVMQLVVKNNPQTLFVWSPLYVTSNLPERYEAFSTIYNWTEPNLYMIDLWDLVKKLPKSEGGSIHHIPVGGAHMKESMERIWSAVEGHRIRCRLNK